MAAKTKSERLRRLLSHGFFAPELPPCFVSNDLAKYRRSILNRIEAFPEIQNRPAYYKYITEPVWFYAPRFAKDDRRHGVPNPISYLLLSKVVADNYVQLRKLTKQSGLSASPPVFDWSGARALIRPSIDMRDDFRVNLSSRREEYVAADIRAFFHSVYTHSIPWAIHGKAFAKANRGYNHYGNLLDLLSRNLQDGQTIGLPVGPDTSRLLAEVVASAMDAQLRAQLGVSANDASRYIDDYTISTPQPRSGEDIIASLRQAAALFELELNSDKSAIVPTSTRHTSGWKQALRAAIPTGSIDLGRMQHFFYEVGRVCEDHPDVNVEKYAFSNARTAFMRSTDWSSVQSLLINAYRRNSTLVSLLVEVCILRQLQHGDVNTAILKDFLDHRIPALARANRTGEIVWLLFLAIRLRIRLSRTVTTPLWKLENALVGILVAAAASMQLVEGNADFTLWDASQNSAGLKGSMWLYVYETSLNGLTPSANATLLQQDPYFGPLLEKRVRFLDVDAGFTSLGTTLRNLRQSNLRIQRIRDDFSDDFQVELDEFDEDEDDYDDPFSDVGEY